MSGKIVVTCGGRKARVRMQGTLMSEEMVEACAQGIAALVSAAETTGESVQGNGHLWGQKAINRAGELLNEHGRLADGEIRWEVPDG